MKAIKKITFILFLLSSFWGYSQNTPTVTSAQDWNSSRSNKTSSTSRVSNTNNNIKGKDINISIAYGLSVPSSNFKNNTYAGNGSYFELSGAYYFSKVGLGLSIGQISNPTDNNLSDFTENLGFSVLNNSENIKSTYVGIGPEYKLKLNKFETTFQIKAGMYVVKSFAIRSDNIENPDVTVPFLNLNSGNTKTLSFVSTGVKFDYNINHNLSLFASAGYFTTLSGQLALTERKIEDINNNGVIDQEDFEMADGSIRYSTIKKNTSLSSLNLGFGISYHFSLSTKKYGSDGNNPPTSTQAQDWNSSRSDKTSSTSRVSNDNSTPTSTQAQDWNSSRSNKTSSTAPVDNNDNNTPTSTQAQDWNSSRSNKTSSTAPIDNNDNNTPTSTQAQDWNSSRSNKTSSTAPVDNNDNNTPTSTQAQDWNSSRSNKTSSTAPVDNNDNNTPTSTQAQDWNSSRSNKTSRAGNPNGNNQSQTAKMNCIKSGNIFWENTDGSYSCKTTITKSQKSIKIPSALANDLATAKKIALGDKTQQGIIEITVIYPNKNKITKVSIPRQRVQDTETILQQLLESTQGNGDDNGKVRIKLVAKI